ncbi:MAG: SpoIIE family protein phosphatase [Clostridiales Family XIII bacterium]|jgi:sigma-B regulation protein RsbU (phosphoserine phosphatase)|nr:SpoIIE family protein phosphatase [Clostridiales Family XIII bacterium]
MGYEAGTGGAAGLTPSAGGAAGLPPSAGGEDDLREILLLREMVESTQYLVRILDAGRNVVYMNRNMRERFGDTTGRPCYELFMRPENCENCVSSRALGSGMTENKDVMSGGRCFKLFSSPVTIGTGERFSIEIFCDITEQKQMELELLDHYKKLTSELNLARHIQHSMLPSDGVYWNALRLSTLYLPAEVLGGDLFDIIKVGKDSVLMYIADVSGHGVHASMLTMFLRAVVRGRLREAAKGMSVLMDSIMAGYGDLDIDPEMYFSILLCCYNRARRELSVVNAGHNCYPLIVRKNGEIEEITAHGLPVSKLGAREGTRETVTRLGKGERLVLYTDGIVEEYSRAERKAFGAEGIKDMLRKNLGLDGRALARGIVSAATEFSDAKAKDDRAIMIADVL